MSVAGACATANLEVEGVVIDVVGDIATIESFVLRLPDGADRMLVPAPGILFHGDAALGHIRDHLRSGEPISVAYEVLDDGTWVALEVTDA